jgi:O-antigen ligase
MSMTITYNQIYPGPVWTALLGGLFLLAILKGRPEWPMGMFFAMSGWGRNLWVGPVLYLYALLATAYLAAFVDTQLRLRRGEQITLGPEHDRGVLVLVGCWWLWMLMLIELFAPPNGAALRRNLVLLIIAGIPPLLLFAHDVQRLKGFAIAYICSAVAGGWIALAAYEVPITALLSDPGLNSYGLSNLGLPNYHAIAWTFGCSLILVMALYIQARSLFTLTFYTLLAALCMQFLLLSLSRQSMAASVICIVLFGIWGIFSRNAPKPRVVVLVVGVIAMAAAIYQVAPHLVVREHESGLLESFDLVGDRAEYWRFGWEIFVASPLWGSGMSTPYSHNLLLGTLAEQGLVGGFFLAAYSYFVVRQGRTIVNRRGDPARATWRVAFFLIVLFFIIHSMASGTATNGRHLYWAGLMLWFQSAIVRPAPLPAIPVPTRLVVRPRPSLAGAAPAAE